MKTKREMYNHIETLHFLMALVFLWYFSLHNPTAIGGHLYRETIPAVLTIPLKFFIKFPVKGHPQ